LKKRHFCLHKIALQGISLWHFHVYMYYNLNWFIPSIFLLFTLVLLLWWFQQVLKFYIHSNMVTVGSWNLYKQQFWGSWSLLQCKGFPGPRGESVFIILTSLGPLVITAVFYYVFMVR
jgi:hypothetical protein